tara:strand:+ start:152 stop:364 length:213 start_codon:yes stop_codon:yes gene_type:complete
MWVTCHECLGQGYIIKNRKESNINVFNKYFYNYKIPCPTCVPPGTFLDIIIRGQYWVEDNHDPVSPPSSP